MFKKTLIYFSLFLQLLCSSITAQAYDVLGIGAPCMDILLRVDDAFLSTLPGKKGDSVHLNWQEFSKIIVHGQKTHLSIAAGGCTSNTIKGLASLGQNCAFFGKMGTDDMGHRFLQNITSVGILPMLLTTETPTQQVASLITPDCQRTMYCFPGASEELTEHDLTPGLFEGVRLVYIEGYALYNGTLVKKAMHMAKEAGALVAFDMGCSFVVNKFKKDIQELLVNYVDIVFANEEETKTLTGLEAAEGCAYLRNICGTAVVMIGKAGCWAGSGDELVLSPSVPAQVVDTTGAGDLFASGFLHGYLEGRPLAECAHWGNLTGASVVEVMGAEIPELRWEQLRQEMPKY